MTDEERRIRRMNYLASRIWPPQEEAHVEISTSHCSIVGVHGYTLVSVPKVPFGLDALEALLCAQAREMPSWLLAVVESWELKSHNDEGQRTGDLCDATRLRCAEEIRRSIWKRS
jgi:hypothetical protein